MPVYGCGPPVNGFDVVNPTLQGMNQRPGNVRNPMAGNGLQNVPMQCGSNFDRVIQIQQLLQGLNARELQQVFQNTMTEHCGGLKKGPSDSSKHGAVLLVPDQHLFSVETAALANCACLFNGSD